MREVLAVLCFILGFVCVATCVLTYADNDKYVVTDGGLTASEGGIMKNAKYTINGAMTGMSMSLGNLVSDGREVGKKEKEESD